jgi:diguanylate cyclase (GGDEF)-like protein
LPAVEHIEHIAKVFREMDRQRAMSLVLITIRDLREVNDKHGTDAGDRILKHISGCAQAVAGPGDRVFRSSGNEFVILLNADGSGASGISRALGEAITTTTLDLTNTAQTTIAIATFPEDGSTLDQLLTTARRKHGMELRPQLDGRTQPPESIH